MIPKPFPSDLEALRADLTESMELSVAVVARLVEQARPAVLMTTTASDMIPAPLGASKLGGLPDLPRGVDWPMRPPYPDAVKRAAGHRKKAERLLADSRKPRSWMTREQGEQFRMQA